MSIQINRFEKFQIREKQIAFVDKIGVAIKDHKSDHTIGYVNVFNDLDTNLELADKVIETVEEFILEKENAENSNG